MLTAILSALMMGQLCGPGGCPAPVAPNYYVISSYDIQHDGVVFSVRGYKNDAGLIIWHPEEYGNQAAYERAKAEAAFKALAKAQKKALEPKPEPKPEPTVPASFPHVRPEGQMIGGVANYGVSRDKMDGDTFYTAKSDEARNFIQEARAGDSQDGMLHVTVIGSDADRAGVVADLNKDPAFANIRDRLLIQDYRADEWPVSPGLGFATDGRPTILVQTAKGPRDPKGGKVIYRASDYSMGAAGLAEDIRKADPNYKPSNDPGPAKSGGGLCPVGFTSEHWPAILACCVGLLIATRIPTKKGS